MSLIDLLDHFLGLWLPQRRNMILSWIPVSTEAMLVVLMIQTNVTLWARVVCIKNSQILGIQIWVLQNLPNLAVDFIYKLCEIPKVSTPMLSLESLNSGVVVVKLSFPTFLMECKKHLTNLIL